MEKTANIPYPRNVETMRAVAFDDAIRFVADAPVPDVPEGWARVRVMSAGICATDLEITKGYMGFRGIVGHEFVGRVDECADDTWAGARVVGEINASCGRCEWCAGGLGRHCPHRATLGIDRLDGCMADYCVLPIVNLHRIPGELSDDRAVLTELLTAACEILEQLDIRGRERIVVLGDGPLGILCAWVLATALSDVTLVGHHPDKLDRAAWRHLKRSTKGTGVEGGADIVVDATGSEEGVHDAIALCRPRGRIVLKTTVASRVNLDLSPIVVNELTVVGSRCGQFPDGLRIMQTVPDMPLERLITARYPIEEAAVAFARARNADMLKVIVTMQE